MPAGYHNVDTLIILTEDVEKARQLVQIVAEEDWAADDVAVFDDEKSVGGTIGHSPTTKAIVKIWWD